MSKSICSRIWLGALVLGVSSLANAQTMKPEAGQSMLKSRPSTFTKNVGQWDERALFGGHAAGMDFWVSKEGFVFQYQRTNADKGNAAYAGHTVGMLFDGAKPFTAVGSYEAGTKQFVRKNLPVAHNYRQVKLNGVYDNVDAVAYFDGKAPRYDFLLHPGAKSEDIRFNFKGAEAKVIASNKLQINTVLGDKFQEGLFAYQMVGGKKISVPVSFKQIDATHIGFNVGAYDHSKDLVIDPLVYGTYYGGDQGFDEVRGVAADAVGNVYLTGYTRSAIYPVLYGPFGFNGLGGKDAFVSRLTGDVYVHDYSALIPGTGEDQGNFVRIDPLGNVWVVGSTSSATFAGNNSAGNVWVLRFTSSPSTILTPFHPISGNPVLFRFGGPTANPDVTAVTSLSMRPQSSITPGATIRMMLTGLCKAANGATGFVPGANSGSFYGTVDYDETNGFVIIPGASGLPSATAPNTVTLTGGAYDLLGNFFLSGTLNASGNSDTAQGTPKFDTTGSAWPNSRLQRQKDIWVRKYAPAGGTWTWSGLLGGAADDVTEGFFRTHDGNGTGTGFEFGGSTIATDPAGNVYVLGRSASFDFPRTSGVFGEIYQSGENYITVTKVSSDGSTIVYSTNIRNRGNISACGIGVDSTGNAYLTGVVSANDSTQNVPSDPYESDTRQNAGSIPLVNPIRGAYTMPAIPEVRTNDGWLLILDNTASSIIRSTYIGGILDDAVFAPFVDPNGDVWVYGWTDTWRRYALINSTGTVVTWRPDINGRSGGLDPEFITNLAFKQFPEPDQGPGRITDANAYFQDGNPTDMTFGGSPSALVGIQYRRDGFVLRFRESLPLISTMSLAPSPIPGGDPQGLANPPSAVGTITLSGPAPAGGATINLSFVNPVVDGAAASFLATSSATTSQMIIPAGQTTGTYNVYSKVVPAQVNVQVKANYSGNLKTATLQIVPWLNTIIINGASIVGGNTTTATVKLNGVAPAGGVNVLLTTDVPTVVSFPDGPNVATNILTIPGGQSQATFTIATNGVDAATTAQVNAGLLGVVRTATLGVSVARLTNIVLTPNPVSAGGTVTGYVNLDGKTGAAGTLNVSINGNPAGYVLTPTQVTIPANSNQSSTFTIVTPFEAVDIGRVVKVVRVVSPSDNTVIDGPLTATLNVQANLVSSLVVNPNVIPSGGLSVGTVTLSAAAPVGGARVQLFSDKPGIATPVDANDVPISEVIVAEGTTQATFNIRGLFALNGDENVKISAYRGPTPIIPGLVKSDTLQVLALTYTFTITPNSVFGGQGATGKITLSAPAITGFSMNTITCDIAGVGITQPVFTVGNPVATFAITTPVVTDTVTATFTASAGTLPPVFATLVIKATEVTSIKILPSNRVRQNSTIQVVVTVNRPVPVATPGKLIFTNASLVNIAGSIKTFTIPLGANSTTITLQTRRIPRNLSTQITATVSPSGNGTSVSTTLFVII